jgi:peptide/nickel transport system substrate-binding protein
LSAERIGRRAALFGAASLALAGTAAARGRTPLGGRIAFRLPWPVGTIDPHKADDVAAALFGEALFDGLYAYGEGGRPVPVLADGDPEPVGSDVRIRVRPGLLTAAGSALDAREVIAALGRARADGARGWLADVPNPRRDGESLLFATNDGPKLARSLASPLCAILPATFAADRPDGTGAFRWDKRSGGCALLRNPRAARGPSFLDEVAVTEAPDLAASLRAFEAGTDDLGWLGAGLHEPRAGSRLFDFGAAAFALLRTGKDALAWDVPGVAQRLADGIPPSKLASLALGAPWAPQPDTGWGGPPVDLLVRDDAPWMIELARSVAAALSRPDHAVTAKPVPIRDIRDRRSTRSFALMIDVARAFAPGTFGALSGLATADDPSTAADVIRHPPRVGEVPARTLTRSMRVGVLGDVRVQGARISELVLGPSATGTSFDWPNAYRGRR